jgi:phosphoglycerol transferase MdoB-like AlkP superfamily enzyme
VDKQLIGVIVTIVIVIIPTIGISYAMTAKNAKWQAAGYYGLSAFLFLSALGCFAMAVSGENRAGYAWMTAAIYASYWAWSKAKVLHKS